MVLVLNLTQLCICIFWQVVASSWKMPMWLANQLSADNKFQWNCESYCNNKKKNLIENELHAVWNKKKKDSAPKDLVKKKISTKNLLKLKTTKKKRFSENKKLLKHLIFFEKEKKIFNIWSHVFILKNIICKFPYKWKKKKKIICLKLFLRNFFFLSRKVSNKWLIILTLTFFLFCSFIFKWFCK